MRNKFALATTILGTLGAAPAFADSKMEIGGFVGLHIWNDNNELGSVDDTGREEIEDSPIFGIRIGRELHRMISAEGELALAPATTHPTGADVVGIGYRLHALVHPARFANDRFVPFALVGLGGFTSASDNRTAIDNDSDFLVHGGVGFKYGIGRDWGVRFDARLLLPPAIDGLVTADGEFLIGIYKTFPPKPAAAPKVEPPPPPVTNPTPTDQDGDGLDDTSDRCPAEPEDVDGVGDEDGCPDPDNDGDGVPDAADRCPAQAETANGFQDDDGCPDEVPAAVKQFTGAIRGIDFEVGSATLRPTSNAVLDEAVRVLADYPALRVEISGHTDATGNAAFNRDLSKRRADTVKAYLTGKGIAADRLETVGHGPDKPVADNATPEGRAKNRRVEFKVR